MDKAHKPSIGDQIKAAAIFVFQLIAWLLSYPYEWLFMRQDDIRQSRREKRSG